MVLESLSLASYSAECLSLSEFSYDRLRLCIFDKNPFFVHLIRRSMLICPITSGVNCDHIGKVALARVLHSKGTVFSLCN